MRRVIQNLTTGTWHLNRALSAAEREAITEAVRAAEKTTSAQIKVVVESSLHTMDVIRGQTARERALEVFGLERIWDTSNNNGILLYLLLSEHDAEIVVDRGFNDTVDTETWKAVCKVLESEHARSSFGRAVCAAVQEIGTIARSIFPSTAHPNEISDDVRVR
jgi:uncharacterized membrane protein